MTGEPRMWIGGEWVGAGSGKTLTVVNPSTEEALGGVPLAGEADVDRAVAAACRAFPAWSRTPQAERSRKLMQFAVRIREQADEIARLECLEHGTPLADAKHIVMWAAEIVEYTASAARALMGSHVPTRPGVVAYLQRVPVGVCALITPWNVPFIMMAVKLAPALATGNTCVMKPPSINSLTGLAFARLVAELDLPPGTVNVVTGPGSSIGHRLASHPDVDLVGFTGSTETGRSIMAAASSTIKKLVMELGGKNPFILLEDADVDEAVRVLVGRQYNNSGQHCSGVGRYYVHERVYDEFLEKFVAASSAVVVGDPLDPRTTMGPVVSAEHRAHIERLVESAIAEGARLVLGGRRPTQPPLDRGYYVMPTVIADVTQQMTIAREEVFGPVACIMKFRDHDDIVAMANDTRYGLCAGFFTRDVSRALRLAGEIRTGSVFVNTHMLTPEMPWGGGVKQSGLGKEGSIAGMEEFTELKLVCIEVGAGQ
ncbi:MAG: aldehyde dehydrogenase [Burkholderiaceae bacterium]|nr:aldehyde dehydrogenase [Burkholderiaceae bacterium]